MPIYEFTCGKCGRNFEALCRLDWQGQVACPDCGSREVKKRISLCSSAGRTGGKDTCAGCSAGTCHGCHS